MMRNYEGGDWASKNLKRVVNWERFLGFRRDDVSDWKSFVTLLARPSDPASLAIVRILFGILMMVDIPLERGLGRLHRKDELRRYDITEECGFPLFDFVGTLPLRWLYVVYFFMFAGALGMALGLLYRLSAAVYVLTYWYVFLLDTTAWNNHSFLFGLLAILLAIADANRCWSLDGLLAPAFRDSHVPLWNYALLRAQIFLVYFIAGLKKIDADWLGGYSMGHLSSHWVFLPFRIFLSDEAIDMHLVHHFGFLFDLTVGFFMFVDRTRAAAFTFCAAFNLMNSQLFNIGMFPYVMLAVMPIFCRPDWPRRFLTIGRCDGSSLPTKNEHCLYHLEHDNPSQDLRWKKNGATKWSDSQTRPTSKIIGFYHHWTAGFAIAYVAIQLFLPYSHFITRGYNHWTEDGLYGYSWNMMVHSWTTQHVRVTVRDSKTGYINYIDPEKFVANRRWTRYARLAQQFARCVERNLRRRRRDATDDQSSIEINVDVWASLNRRFVQRVFDNRVNLLTAEWSPFARTRWTMPLLEELNRRWRDANIRRDASDPTTLPMMMMNTFVADFPGFFMENSVHSATIDLNDTSVEVLEGRLVFELFSDGSRDNVTIAAGDSIQVPANKMHRLHVVSDSPAAYVYRTTNVAAPAPTPAPAPVARSTVDFWRNKYDCFEQSWTMTMKAIRSVVWGSEFEVGRPPMATC